MSKGRGTRGELSGILAGMDDNRRAARLDEEADRRERRAERLPSGPERSARLAAVDEARQQADQLRNRNR
jgi:hypothetical protein